MSGKEKKETLVDRKINGMKNHPLISIFIFLGVVIIALSSVTESVEKIARFLAPAESGETSNSNENNGDVIPEVIEGNPDEAEDILVNLEQEFNYSGVDSCGEKRDSEASKDACDSVAESYAKANSMNLISVEVIDFSSRISKKKEPWPSNARSCKSNGTVRCKVILKAI